MMRKGCLVLLALLMATHCCYASQMLNGGNGISTPATSAPHVTLTLPKDSSTQHLVDGTWALVLATFVLALATVWMGTLQSKEARQRDRAALMRDANRSAHKVMVVAKQLEQLARQVPVARAQMHISAGQGSVPAPVADIENRRMNDRLEALEKMTDDARLILPRPGETASPLPNLSDKQLSERLWHLDNLLVSLEALRDAITEELDRYETANARLLRERNEKQTAITAARMSRPPDINKP